MAKKRPSGKDLGELILNSWKKALKQERALTASQNRYIEALEQNLAYQKELVQELRKKLELLQQKKE